MTGAAAIAAFACLYLAEPTQRTEAPPHQPRDSIAGEGVDSGTGVPPFPRTLVVDADRYALLGLGIRTVSFLRIQVYVVGFYVHEDDLPALRAAIRATRCDPAEHEPEALRRRLLDPVEGEELWDALLSGGAQFRSAFRIVPTRNTGRIPPPVSVYASRSAPFLSPFLTNPTGADRHRLPAPARRVGARHPGVVRTVAGLRRRALFARPGPVQGAVWRLQEERAQAPAAAVAARPPRRPQRAARPVRRRREHRRAAPGRRCRPTAGQGAVAVLSGRQGARQCPRPREHCRRAAAATPVE